MHTTNGNAQIVGADVDSPIRGNVAERQKGNGVAVTSSARGSLWAATPTISESNLYCGNLAKTPSVTPAACQLPLRGS